MMNDLGLSEEQAQYCTSSIVDHVVTVTMNKPAKLNGWTLPMIEAFREAFCKATENDAVKAIIFTGNGVYFSAGVNLSSTIKLMPPKQLKATIAEMNQALFDMFLNISKPILIAINGPAIGASVTSATLCNGVIASANATFLLPFARLGVPPEGCSTVHLPRLIGPENAERMMGPEGWAPNAQDALEIGLIQSISEPDALLTDAQAIAKEWVANDTHRNFMAGSEKAELLAANKAESLALANAFLSPPFLHGQAKFLWSKKKYGPALTFYALVITRPIWQLFL
jgi:enoyl-CoA hydratase/carnithine racemase